MSQFDIPKVDVLLDKIEQAACIVNQEEIAATKLIQKVQDRLVAMNFRIGFYLSVPLAVENHEEYRANKLLGFSPTKIGWAICLLHKSTYKDRLDMTVEIPLLEAALEYKTKAAGRMVELLETALERINCRVLIVQSADT